jgi:hypothetical protein
MVRKQSSEMASALEQKGWVARHAEQLIGLVTIITVILPIAFSFLKLSQAIKAGEGKFLEIFLGLPSTAVLHFTLALYFFSWCFGTKSDLKALRNIFTKSPLKNIREALAAVVVLVGVFFVLCLVKHPATLVFVLLGFWSTDFLFVFFIHRTKVKKGETDARLIYKDDVLLNIKLNAVVHQNIGSWRWERFGFGFGYIGFLIVLVYTRLDTLIGAKIGAQATMVFSIAFLVFVVIAEAWMWEQRFRRNAVVQAIEQGIIRLGKGKPAQA